MASIAVTATPVQGVSSLLATAGAIASDSTAALGNVARLPAKQAAPAIPALASLGLPADQAPRRSKFQLQDTAARLIGSKRLRSCTRIPLGSTVEIRRHASGSCSYRGLETCGSVWACPVCASKISERRRVELAAAIATWKAQGNSVAMVTLTFPHYRHDCLDDLLCRFAKALERLSGYRAFKDWRNMLQVVGSIRALEVTHGENSWHPHSHLLVFAEGQPTDWRPDLVLKAWKAAARLAGLPEPSESWGVDVRAGDEGASAYLSKWGLERELTKAHMKKGRSGSRSPWDLLRDADDGDIEAAELFQEYARNFRGRKQLHWGRGLRDRLGLGVELTDKELADQVEESSAPVALLDRQEWALIVAYGLRGQLLEVAASEGLSGVCSLVDCLALLPRRSQLGGDG